MEIAARAEKEPQARGAQMEIEWKTGESSARSLAHGPEMAFCKI